MTTTEMVLEILFTLLALDATGTSKEHYYV